MKNNPAILSCLLVIVFLSACASPPTEISPATDWAPTETSGIQGTSTPTIEPPDPGDLPSGVLSMGVGTSGVRLTTFDGQVIEEMKFTGFSLPSSSPTRNNHFHFGGTTEDGVSGTPCFFYSAVIYDKAISYHTSKSPIINLQEIQGLINLVGARRLPLVVYSTYDPENLQYFNHNRYSVPPEDDSQPTSVPATVDSWLYTTNRDNIPETDLLLSHADESGYAVFPLLAEMDEETLQGVWYTLSYEAMHGGGPIIYSGQRGLYYLDLAAQQTDEILSSDQPFLALSASREFLAYKAPGEGDNGQVVIQAVRGGDRAAIEILPETHPTGIGSAFFSPGDSILAWQEHYLGEEGFGILFRFAGTSEGELMEIDSAELISKTGDLKVYHIRLAGWADENRVILEALSPDRADLYLLDLADPSLAYLAPGRFVGLTFP